MNLTKEEKESLTRRNRILKWLKYKNYITTPFLVWFSINLLDIMRVKIDPQPIDMLVFFGPIIFLYLFYINIGMLKSEANFKEKFIEESLKTRFNPAYNDSFDVSFQEDKVNVVMNDEAFDLV